MSFELSANVERELERYASAEHLSPAQAAERLLSEALKARQGTAGAESVIDRDWELYRRLVPGFEIFHQMPDRDLDDLADGSARIRAETLSQRG
jgi:2-methylcitrate dehydratase PrpD